MAFALIMAVIQSKANYLCDLVRKNRQQQSEDNCTYIFEKKESTLDN